MAFELKPKALTPQEIQLEEAKRRRRDIKKTAEEREAGVVKIHQDSARTKTEIDRLEDQLKRIKNEKERKEIYARLSKLVEEKKKLNKKLGSAIKKMDADLSEEELRLRKEEIYNDGGKDSEAHVGSGDFEYRKTPKRDEKNKKTLGVDGENLSEEDLKLRKQEIYQDGDNYTEEHVGGGEFEYRVTSGSRETTGEGGYKSEESRKIIEEMKALKKRAKELGAKGEFYNLDEKELVSPDDRPKPTVEPGTPVPPIGLISPEPAPAPINPEKPPVSPEPVPPTPPNLEEEQERAEKLRELEDNVAKFRMEYVKKDHKVMGVMGRLKNILGRGLKSNPNNFQETHWEYGQYKIALKDLMDFKLADLKEKNLPPDELRKEMGELVKYYNQDEKLNLYEARTNARAAVWEEKWGRAGKLAGWLGKKSSQYTGNFINWYRKKNWKTKMAVGVGASLVGLGLLNRAWGSVLTGTGVTMGLEARYRQKEGKKRTEEQAKIMSEVEAARTPEEMYTTLMGKLEAEMDGYQAGLKKELRSADRRKLAGLAAGTGHLLFSLYAMPRISSALKGWLGFPKIGGNIGSDASNDPTHGWKSNSNIGSDASHGGHEWKTPESAGSDASHGGHEWKTPESAGSDASHGGHEWKTPESAGSDASHGGHEWKTPESAGSDASHGGHEWKTPESVGSDASHGGHEWGSADRPSVGAHPEPGTPGGHGHAYTLEPEAPAAVSGIEVAHRGDSVWKLINHQLETRYGAGYGNLSEAQKTYMIDHFKDQVAKDPQSFGLKDIDRIRAGQKIDFSRLFESQGKVSGVFSHAEHLTPEETQNILKNNRTLINWLHKHPGEFLSSPKVNEILSHQGGGKGAWETISERPVGGGANVPGRISSGGSGIESHAPVEGGDRVIPTPGHEREFNNPGIRSGLYDVPTRGTAEAMPVSSGGAKSGVMEDVARAYDKNVESFLNLNRQSLSRVAQAYYEFRGFNPTQAVEMAKSNVNNIFSGLGINPDKINIPKGASLQVNPEGKLEGISGKESLISRLSKSIFGQGGKAYIETLPNGDSILRLPLENVPRTGNMVDLAGNGRGASVVEKIASSGKEAFEKSAYITTPVLGVVLAKNWLSSSRSRKAEKIFTQSFPQTEEEIRYLANRKAQGGEDMVSDYGVHFRTALQKMAMETGIFPGMTPEELKGINAAKYLEAHKKDPIGRLYALYKSKIPEAAPKELTKQEEREGRLGENMNDWLRKFLGKVIESRIMAVSPDGVLGADVIEEEVERRVASVEEERKKRAEKPRGKNKGKRAEADTSEEGGEEREAA